MPEEYTSETQILCPNCGESVDPVASHCPHCGEQLYFAAETDHRVQSEAFTYHLGDFLVNSGAINEQQLRQALDYQTSISAERHILLGQALLEIGVIDRNTLDKAISAQLITLQEALKETNNQVEIRIQARTKDLESRLIQIHTAAEITQLVTSATDREELLRCTVDLMVARFGYYYTSIFLVDESQMFAELVEASGASQNTQVSKGYKINAGVNSIVGWVLANRQVYVAGDVKNDELFMEIESLPDTRSEVAIPIGIGDKLFAVLDIQHTLINEFDPETINILQTIANHIASALQNARLLEKTQSSLKEIYILYQSSHQLAQSSTSSEVMHVILSALQRSPHLSALFSVERTGLRLIFGHRPDQDNWHGHSNGFTYPEWLDIPSDKLENVIGLGANYKIVDISDKTSLGGELPSELTAIPTATDCKSLALIPGWNAEKLEFLIVLGDKRNAQFTLEVLEPYCSLASMAILTLTKVNTSQRLEKRLAALQTLNTVSQAVSIETDLRVLYQVIHREVTSIIGKVNFAIATYDEQLDSITVPYMYDGQTTRSVEAFPMGEGLTSILIRTKKPLLVVEDTERRTRELGAKQVGKPAKSWLGVPLLVGGDVIGAILLQDLENEGRFDEDDQRLLETLASQVAVAIRNARLLENTLIQAARQQKLYEITSKIRNSADIPSILQTTASELSKALGARRTTIELAVPSPEQQETASEK